MAQKTDAQLSTQKDEIKNETVANANSATRIGQMIEDLNDSKINNVDAYTKPFPQVTASGTDTYTATLSPAITAYALGQKFQILFTNANTGAATLNLNAVGALAITKNGATALAAGDIAAGSIKILAYDGTRLQVIGDGGGSGAVESVTGDGVDNTDPANPVINVNTVLRESRIVTSADACVQGDDNTLIIFNSGTPFNFTIDTLTIGSKFSWINYGSADVTFVNGSGVTLDGTATAAGRDGDVISAGLIDFSLSATVPISTTGGGASPGITYWQTLPGTPTRVGDTQLTITDTANANLYNLKFGRGTVLKWTDTTTHLAMVSSASYSSNTVTINIIGDVLSGTATMNTFTFGLEKALVITRAIAGTIATGTNLTAKYFSPMSMKVFGGKAFHGTAGTTNATTYDINKNGTTMFTTKLSVASAATVGTVTTADDNTTLAADDVLTYDCVSVSTTAPIDAYIDLYVMPLNNQYL